MKTIHQLNELITYARQHSGFYKETLSPINQPITAVAQLPLTDPVDY
ncbi:hypothetical protein [Pseudomonas sp. 18058]|nr:hypothetical protein [Pseudomonas sp. 18058]